MVTVGLEEREKRDKELAMFRTAHGEACKQNQQQSTDRVKEFEKYKLKVCKNHTCYSLAYINPWDTWGIDLQCEMNHITTQILPEVGRGVVIDGDDEQGQPLSGGTGSEAGNQLRKAIDELQRDLMKLEMHLVEQIDVREKF